MENNQQGARSDTDYLNKRIADLEKLVGIANKNYWPLVSVVQLIIICVLLWLYVDSVGTLSEARLTDLKTFLKMEMKQEVKTELQPTKELVKETTEEVKTTINEFKEKTQ